jgi:hypothetical protein
METVETKSYGELSHKSAQTIALASEETHHLLRGSIPSFSPLCIVSKLKNKSIVQMTDYIILNQLRQESCGNPKQKDACVVVTRERCRWKKHGQQPNNEPSAPHPETLPTRQKISNDM